MPNLMVDALKTFGSGTSIGTSVVEMVSDAKAIKETVMGGAKNAKETYRNMRQNGFRKVTDWFFQRGDEYGLNSTLDDNGDDFDAGFNYGSDDSESDSSQVLDYEGMKGIAKGQVSAMYNIAGKQAEATAMSASEVISNFNDRSSEILSSLGTINSSLESISAKLDKLVVAVEESSNSQKTSFFDANGNLTLGSVFGGLKGAAYQRYGQWLDLGKTLMGSLGQITPGQLIGTIAGMAVGDKQFQALNNRSINDISDALTDKFQNAMNVGFTKLLESNIFKKIFGDHTRMSGGKDYGAYIENQYTKDRAVFDGITRKTIVDVIPSYLRKITEALTGQTYHISEYGTLTTERAEGFQQVARYVIADGLRSKQISSITASNTSGESINDNDVTLAQRILLGLYVGASLDERKSIVSSDILKNGGVDSINTEAAQILSRKTNKPASYWMTVIGLINESFNTNSGIRENFIRTINKTVQHADSATQKYVEEATFIDDIGEITHDMIVKALEENVENVMNSGGDTRTYGDLIKAKEITEADMPPGAKKTDRVSDEAIRQARLNRARQSDIITNPQQSIKSAVASTVDYLASIFEILNRGVNVYPVKQKKKFAPIKLKRVSDTSTASVSTPVPDVNVADNTPSTPVPTPTDQTPSHVETPGEEDDGQPTGDGQPADQTPGQQLANSAKGLVNSVTSYIGNPNKFVGKVKNSLSNEWTNLKSDVVGWKDQALDQAAGWADRQVGENGKTILQNDVDKLDDANDDKQKANEILSTMQTAAAGGDTTKAMSTISELLNGIKDQKLKARLERTVNATLNNVSETKPAKSKIGGILLWGFGLAKKFLGGVFSKAKTFFTAFGKKIVTPIINSLKSSVKKITTGAKAVKEGFIGSKTKYRKAQNGEAQDDEGYAIDENGNRIVEREGTTGLVQDVAALGKKVWNGKVMTGVRNVAGTVAEGAKTVAGKAADAAGKFVDWMKEPGILSSFTQLLKQGVVNTASAVGGAAMTAKDKIADKMGDLKEKFANTSFGKGWMEAWKDPEEEKKKNPEPKTAADFATKTIAELLKNVDGKGEGGAETAISSIIGFLKSTSESIQQKIEGDEKKEDEDNKEEGNSEVVQEGSESGTESSSTESSGSSEGSTPTVDLSSGGGGSTDAAPAADTGGGDAGASTGGATAAAGGAQGGGGIGGKLKGLLGGGKAGGIGFDIGKMLGGMTKILFGIAQAVLTVVMSMEGFKAIMNLGMDILKKSLKPLNKAFQAIYKALKPIVKTVTRLLKEIVGYVVEIVQSVIKFIQPILEAIEPIISSLLETLMPILDMITDLVDVLLVPLIAMLKVTVIPTLQFIGNTLEILLGIVQVGLGIILTALGGILVAVGTIVKWLTGSEGIKDTGKQLWDTGTNMVKSGSQSVVSGMKKTISLFGDTIKNALSTGDQEEEEETPKSKKKKNVELHGSALEGTYGSGDEYDETYGGAGANQHKYGTYLNMSKRGCGPVAIADAYARRTGRSVDAAQLATSMNSAGTYSQNAGTSVSGYIKTSKALGMNLTPGGVTSTSLRTATPSNPITIVGSGPSFTTRNGNNHYMNVIGSDSHGTAYVSNPMTGRVERKNINSLATSSVLGLYGSGDANSPYALNDETQDALTTLKEIVQSILSIFSGEGSVEDALAKEEEKNEYERMQYETANMTEEEQAEIDKRARELFEAEHGRYQGETDAQFEKRYQKYKQKYWAIAATEKVREKVKASADGSDEGAMSLINSTLGDDGMISKFSSSMESVDDSVQAGGLQSLLESLTSSEKKSSGAARYESDNGAIMWTDMYKPQVRKNQGSGWSRNAPQSAYQLILDEFFRNTVAPSIKITGAFKQYLDPVSDDMVGTRGEEHSGADFTIGGNPEIHATTGGRVVEVGIDNDHFGNYVKIQDIGGDYHIYAHLKDIKVSEGDEIEGGDVIGTMGHTGSSQVILKQSDSSHGDTSLIQSGDRLHYEIRNSDNEILNPFTFFKYKRGGGKNGSITLDPQEAMYRAASEVFVKAREANGGDLKWNGTSPTNITFDDGFIINGITPTHCTSMMGAVVKRMGYYTYPGSGYSDTNQGESYMGGNVAQKWGVSGTKGKAKIYNRDGTISDDWEVGPGSAWQPGDIMFNGTGDAHAHMPVFTSADGQWLGFNGGADDSLANSVKLGKYYLENNALPEGVTINDTGKWCNDHPWTDQMGAIAPPMSYYVRYVGDPVTFVTGEAGEDDYFGDDYFSEEDAAAMTAAGVTEGVKAKSKNDNNDCVPAKWEKLGSGYGVVKNAAGVELAKWYKPTGNATADLQWQKAHPDYIPHLRILGDGSSYIVWVYGFNTNIRKTVGSIVYTPKVWFAKNKPVNSSTSSSSDSSNANKPGVISTNYDRAKYKSDLYRAGVWKEKALKTRMYNSGYDNLPHLSKISWINGKYSPRSVKYALNSTIIDNAISNGVKLWEKSPSDVNDGTNVVNPGTNTQSPTTTTTTNPVTYQHSGGGSNWGTSGGSTSGGSASVGDSNWWSSVAGGGDISSVVPTLDLGGSIADQIVSMADSSDQSGSPIIVNQYAAQQPVDGSDPINAILTNTYNVRSEKIESILENMLTLMKERNQRKRNQQSASSLGLSTKGDEASGFSTDDIPQSVERLSVG
ncbi:MAG: peptidoglycan DD-metalloendopeptidase family protein [Paludibacteraceae bacterium]|nr:peptidoglycan DD-metalloendopeptidase family protein [Paludibacteraceae bacterium]